VKPGKHGNSADILDNDDHDDNYANKNQNKCSINSASWWVSDFVKNKLDFTIRQAVDADLGFLQVNPTGNKRLLDILSGHHLLKIAASFLLRSDINNFSVPTMAAVAGRFKMDINSNRKIAKILIGLAVF
jgi:hypothetical protein